tara:strand:- start:302 stop:1291 length:990 start_codon:yes stop_codon:yes gene_type:complete
MENILQPIRQYVLHIRSKDAEMTGELNSHLLIDLKEPIVVNSRDEELHMVIETGEIPYSFYNVSSNVDNDRILLNGSTTYTISNQNYDATQLASVLTADDAFPFSMTYNKYTMKYTFTNQAVGSTTINWSGSYANKLLGFPTGDNAPDSVVAEDASITSTNVIDLASVHSLFVKSNTSASMVFSTRSGFSQIIQKISIDQNSGYIIYLNQNDNRQQTILYNSVDFLDLKITDQNNNLINFNGCNYEFSINFYIYPLQKRQRYDKKIDTNRVLRVPRALSQPTNNNQMRQANNIILRPIEENVDETEIEHKGKKFIIDEIIRQQIEASKQ